MGHEQDRRGSLAIHRRKEDQKAVDPSARPCRYDLRTSKKSLDGQHSESAAGAGGSAGSKAGHLVYEKAEIQVKLEQTISLDD